jgi:hypothetical protein
VANIQAVIFDLDGTLVDSLDDIASALGGAMGDAGLPAPPALTVRAWIGDGARNLVVRAVEGRADVDAVLAAFRERYRAAPVVKTQLYGGVAAALDALAAPGRSFAILSNKPHDLTQVIADRLLSAWPFAAVFGQRTGNAAQARSGGGAGGRGRAGRVAGAMCVRGRLRDRHPDRARRRDARHRRDVGVPPTWRAGGGGRRRDRGPTGATCRSDLRRSTLTER